jgi:hypothetical protein
VYEQALRDLGEDANDEELFMSFAKFEEICQDVQLKLIDSFFIHPRVCLQWERARAIYRYALDHIPKHRAVELYKTYTAFEKQHGDRLVRFLACYQSITSLITLCLCVFLLLSMQEQRGGGDIEQAQVPV